MKYVRSLMKKAYRGEGGFTLIELLVVVAILGVIAAVVVLNVGGFMGSGTQDSANTEAHQVQTAIIAYMAATHSSTVAQDGTVTPLAPGIAADYLIDPAKLQADYVYNSDGSLKSADPITDSKWSSCLFASGSWTCT